MSPVPYIAPDAWFLDVCRGLLQVGEVDRHSEKEKILI